MATAYVNGRVYTVDPTRPWAEAALVEDGVFTAVGSDGEVRAAAPPGTDVVDLGGRMVMPGIHDAHIHLLASGLKFRFEARLTPFATPEQIAAELAACGCTGPAEDGGEPWLVGGEYFPQGFGEAGPDRAFLDEVFPDRPVFLYDYSIHHGLANTRALEAAGLTAETEDPPGGRYPRRPGTRELTGELVEQARWPVMRAIPDHPDEVYRDAVAWAAATCHRFGITSVQEASASPQALRAFGALDRAGQLDLHVAAHLVWREEGFGMASTAQLDRSIAERASAASAHVDTRFIKIWLDGAPLPPHMTQADIAPDGSVDPSRLLVPADELAETLRRFDAEGCQVKVHTAGEGAVRAALDAFEAVREANGSDGPRHELAHTAFIHEDDYARFGRLDVVAEMSPAIWHIPEFGLQHGFKFATVLRSGATMTVGSDWIITPDPNLFPALQGMLEWGEDAVDIATALRIMTLGGAEAVGRGDRQGSIEVGKSADFIVLDRDLLEIPADQVGGTRVLRTVFEGRTVFEAAPSSSP
ncbi:amidohydrolase [Blastococcus sp. SYSU D00820]